MKITALVENTATGELKAKHGLALYIETAKHKILFDVGPDRTLFSNAARRNIDLTQVDTVILSHGHIDHGGALKAFLKRNSTAKIYAQRKAFEPHYSKVLFLKVSVGIAAALKNHPQMVLVDGDFVIDDELRLFTVQDRCKCHSPVNDVLYNAQGMDDFSHEQNLLISENEVALLMGCGHAGVVNILDKAKAHAPTLCIGGFHLYNPISKKGVPDEVLRQLAVELQRYPETMFYTCHCTFEKPYRTLAKAVPNLHYLHCGDTIER